MNYFKQRSKIPDGHYYDIFDGAMFKDLRSKSDTPFYKLPHPLFFTLNVDWFQPFSKENYSVGAIYLSINNFPRGERMKQENVILVGLIPGPKEPNHTHLMHYITPLVDELIELYEGVRFKTKNHPGGVLFHGALLNLACDIPASRKVGGFTGSRSTHACNKCDKVFEFRNSLPNFSGMTARHYTQRSRESNLEAALKWKNATSEDDQVEIAKSLGCRYTPLHRLEYFDVVRQTIIDPMHNLLLGTCRRMVKIVWKFKNPDLLKMQEKANLVEVPPGFENLRKRIAGDFSSFKADQWKSWCLIYSPFVLIDVLSKQKLKHWIGFVDACRLLLKSSLTQEDVEKAHALLLEFNSKVEQLYPTVFLTVNNHLHGHLKNTIEDFSVPHAYWLFGFERFNGVFSRFKTNNHNVELTFMRKYTEKVNLERHLVQSWKFFDDTQHEYSQYGHQFATDLMEFFTDTLFNDNNSRSTSTRKTVEEGHIVTDELVDYAVDLLDHPATGVEVSAEDVVISKKMQKVRMAPDHLQYLMEFYEVSYPKAHEEGELSRYPNIEKFKSIRLHGKIYHSAEAQSKAGNWVQCLFLGQYQDRNNNDSIEYWTGKILYFFKHNQNVFVQRNTKRLRDRDLPPYIPKEHLFAFVRFLNPNGNQSRTYTDCGLQEWKSTFADENIDCIIPIARIHSQVAVAKKPGVSSNLIIIPLPHNIHR